jgi:hypothetical protein
MAGHSAGLSSTFARRFSLQMWRRNSLSFRWVDFKPNGRLDMLALHQNVAEWEVNFELLYLLTQSRERATFFRGTALQETDRGLANHNPCLLHRCVPVTHEAAAATIPHKTSGTRPKPAGRQC